jgi:hypothetical protein
MGGQCSAVQPIPTAVTSHLGVLNSRHNVCTFRKVVELVNVVVVVTAAAIVTSVPIVTVVRILTGVITFTVSILNDRPRHSSERMLHKDYYRKGSFGKICGRGTQAAWSQVEREIVK